MHSWLSIFIYNINKNQQRNIHRQHKINKELHKSQTTSANKALTLLLLLRIIYHIVASIHLLEDAI